MSPGRDERVDIHLVTIIKRNTLSEPELKQLTMKTTDKVASALHRNCKIPYSDGSLQTPDGRGVYGVHECIYFRELTLQNWAKPGNVNRWSLIQKLNTLSSGHNGLIIISDPHNTHISFNSSHAGITRTVRDVNVHHFEAQGNRLLISLCGYPHILDNVDLAKRLY